MGRAEVGWKGGKLAEKPMRIYDENSKNGLLIWSSAQNLREHPIPRTPTFSINKI